MTSSTTSTTVPTVATHRPVRFTDGDVGYHYIEFPDDVFFMESVAANPEYRGGGVAYVPVMRLVGKQKQSHLYEIRPNDSAARHVCGPILAPDGSSEVTVFGSALNGDGMLYLCSFNRNSILLLDLKTVIDDDDDGDGGEGGVGSAPGGPATCQREIGNVPAPNDVCIDPEDSGIIYVAGGKFSNCCCMCSFSNASDGAIYKIFIHDGAEETFVRSDGLGTLAGIEVLNKRIWTAQLYNIVSSRQHTTTDKPDIVWRGVDGEGMVWMADNVDIFDGSMLLAPAYTVAPEISINWAMKRPYIIQGMVFLTQIVSAVMHGETFHKAIRDPEVSLSFSNTYIKEGVPPSPLRLIFLDPEQQQRAYHFEVDLVETRAQHPPRDVKDPDTGEVLGQRDFFNEQVTHAAHLVADDGEGGTGQGFVACINFEQPRILMLNDRVFKDAMK